MNKNQLMLLASVFIITVLAMYLISLSMTKNIVVVDKGINMNVKTTSRTVGSMLKRAKIELNEKDKLSISENTKLEDDMKINITRSKPFTIEIDGEVIKGATTYKLISDVLNEYNVELGEFDMVTPSINSILNKDDIISIRRVEKEHISVEEVVTYSTVIKMVKDLSPGQVRKVSQGKDGLKKVEYEVVKEDGIEISRYIVDEEIKIESESEIIEKGIDKLYVTSRGKPFRYKEMIYMESTAYDLSFESCGKLPGEPGYGITYSGTQARPGVIAVDPRIIPLGSKVYVESTDGRSDYGFAIAEDTGSAIRGNRVDLFIGDRSTALRYGRRNVKIYIIEDPVDSELIKGYGK